MSEKESNSFFIVSCGRSGSTSLARILDMANNGHCAMEPVPNLNIETRLMMEGRLADPISELRNTVIPRVRANVKDDWIYGEKNVTYGPFIGLLYDELACKFVFIKRDGRDVVRSLLDWHNRMFGTIYRECKDPGELTSAALKSASNLPVHLDTSDFSRPRPLPNEPLYHRWEDLTRFEMCSYYWQRINNIYLDQLEELPEESWIMVDYTEPTVADIRRVIEFLNLNGIEDRSIKDALDRKTNSLDQRRVTDGKAFLHWREWPEMYRRMFDDIAGETMIRLGFGEYRTAFPNFDFGKFWKIHNGGSGWYQWMYDQRILQHQAFQRWFRYIQGIDSIETVADFGCGTGAGYIDFFKEIRFVGIDLAPHIIEWCRNHDKNTNHEYRVLELITNPPDKEFDLVFSHGTIDNVYDMNSFLLSAVRASKKWIYLTGYRGFFHELDRHRYDYNDEQGIYYNDISPSEAYYVLRDAGCRDISIHPSPTGRHDIPFETVIIAHV